MSESDAEFVERLSIDRNGPIYEAEMTRLLALAERGAAMQPMIDAANALIDFHNGPQETRRPDIHHMLLVKLCRTLPPPPQKEGE